LQDQEQSLEVYNQQVDSVVKLDSHWALIGLWVNQSVHRPLEHST